MGIYKCRFCSELMNGGEKNKAIMKGEKCLYKITFFTCKKCGVIVQEITLYNDGKNIEGDLSIKNINLEN